MGASLGCNIILPMFIRSVLPITMTARCEVWTVFVPLNTGIVGSNPTQGMDVCARLFCFYVVLYRGRDLARGWSPVQGVIPTVYVPVQAMKFEILSYLFWKKWNLGYVISRCLYIPAINFWMPEPVFMKIGTYIMAPQPISTTYFIKPSRQFVCHVHPLSLLGNSSIKT
jgi:hypothetical protein